MANSLIVHIMLKEGGEVPKVSVQPEFIGAGFNMEQTYFDHISLIQAQNHVPFFLWTPCSSRNIL